VTDAGVQAIAAGCKHLGSLIIRDSAITDAALLALSVHCTALSALLLLHCVQVTEAGLAALAASCRSLDMHILNSGIDEAAVARIKSGHPKCSVSV
jgi:hypothetical protein